MANMIDYILRNAGSSDPGLYFEHHTYTHGEIVLEAQTRGSAIQSLGLSAPFHVGVLLENIPEALFWLEGIALAGGTTVGINWTRRGEELGHDIRHTDCQLVVTDSNGVALLDEAHLEDIPRIVIDAPDYESRWIQPYRGRVPESVEVKESDRFVLIFTSGTTSAPKAAICSHGRIVRMATGIVQRMSITKDDVAYNSMPWFHSNALYVSIATSIVAGAGLATRRRFSASGWIKDVKEYGVTYFNYVGKPLEYILATPGRADDSDNRLRFGIGNEANEHDIELFSRRFGVQVNDGFGSTEMGVSISRVPGMPAGALGLAPDENTLVMNPATGMECPRATFDEAGHLTNADDAIGEMVNKKGLVSFEGYYNNEEANEQRSRDGWFWSGDLAYRDEGGFFFFAGRGYDWIRVDGENFAAAPIERILLRYPEAFLVAVYGVPDPRVGDQVMAALKLQDDATFDPESFAAFLSSQNDLGTKWAPKFVRLATEFPLTLTNKIEKRRLRSELWKTSDPVWIRDATTSGYRRMTADDVEALDKEFSASGRASALRAN